MSSAPRATRDPALYESAWAASDEPGWRLSWAEPLESDFQASYAARYRHHMVLGLAVGALAMVFSVFEDYLLPEAERAWPLFVRFGVVMPVVLLLIWLIRKPAADRYQQGMLLFATLGGAAAFLMMGFFVESPLGRMYLDTLILIQMFGLTLLRMQFPYAVASVGVITAGTTAVLRFTDFPPHDGAQFIDLMLIVFAGMLCLVANYLMERSARADYLQQVLLELRQHELEQSNSHLEQLLRSDALTGIANRRCFDQALADEFRRAERGGYPLALCMLDVDSFKQFNDTYGHQAGDETLVQVAGALARFARRPGDLAARYGGEEFALILPGSSEQDALAIAEELVAHVHALALPHATSRVSDRVTVSIGVAAALPGADGPGEADLIANADQALYLAKARGRNRACGFGMLATPAG